MPAPTIIRDSDASAPTLTGQAGSLLNVLDFALVPGLGWGKPFTGTNRAVYRPSAGVRDYLDVNDNGPNVTATFKNAYVLGFETMSAVGVGTAQFPNAGQVTTNGILAWGKSNTLDATARPWMVIGDDRTAYFFSAPTQTTATRSGWGVVHVFGDYYSHKSSDTDKTVIDGGGITTVSTGAPWLVASGGNQNYASDAVGNSLVFTKRSYAGGTPGCYLRPFGPISQSGNAVDYLMGYWYWPDSVDGWLRMNKIGIYERGTLSNASAAPVAVRGRYRGVFQSGPYSAVGSMTAPIVDGFTFSGQGAYAGRSFIYFYIGIGQYQGLIFETGAAWETSS